MSSADSNATIQWLADGTPISPRFDDIYRSSGDDAQGALIQAREIFLNGCDLPRSWRGLDQWRILETGFGLGLNFLSSWHAWRADPERSRMLHFVSVEAWPVAAEDIVKSAAPFQDLHELAELLSKEWFGLDNRHRGFHRMTFDEGRVTLTLCIGDAKAMLREQSFRADAVFLDGFNPAVNPEMWDRELVSLVAACCRSGTRIATWTVARHVRDALTEAGFAITKVEGAPPKRHSLIGRFHTASPATPVPAVVGRAVVVGAGISGASVASSLARRGWTVSVLDSAAHAAAGASALPAGLVSAHVSPDDAFISRLTRAGVRYTLAQARRRLRQGIDWAHSGVLHRDDLNSKKKPAEDVADYAPWFERADQARIEDAQLPEMATALWHEHAAWISPRTLVYSWLGDQGVTLITNARVLGAALADGQWTLQIAGENCAATAKAIAKADLLVIASADGAKELFFAITQTSMALSSVRGQLSIGVLDESDSDLPKSPINGHGTFICDVPLGEITGQAADARVWLAGSTFERNAELDAGKAHLENLEKLHELWPPASMHASLSQPAAIWSGTRCVSRDRLPAIGAPLPDTFESLMLSTAMGSRGLTLAALCGEVLVATLHGEPLPIEKTLAKALAASRLTDKKTPD